MRIRVSRSFGPSLGRGWALRFFSIGLCICLLGAFLQPIWKQWFGSSLPTTDSAEKSPEIDYRVTMLDEEGELADDEFRLVGTPTADNPQKKEAPLRAAANLLDRTILDGVRDNTLGIRRDEASAYYAVIDHLRKTPVETLERAARTDKLYVNLMTDSNRLRGELVTITGDLRRLSKIPDSESYPQSTPLYEGWVFTADSGTNPYRVVATEIPAGVEVQQDAPVPVRVTGYFFKKEGYETPAGLHVAPTLLVKQIERYRSVQSPPPTENFLPYMMGVVGAIALAILVTLVSFSIADRRAMVGDLRRFQLGSGEGLADLKEDPSLETVGESLRRLAQEAEQQHPSAETLAPTDQDLSEMEGQLRR